MIIEQLTHDKVLSILPDRKVDAHKGDFGKILLLCGSVGMTGAAALAAFGALRTGAGLVYLGVPESIYAIEAIKLTEPLIYPLFDKNGMLSAEAAPRILELCHGKDAVLVGPGLGQNKDTEYITEFVLKNYCGPVVLDADGINLLKAHKDILRDRVAPTIMTPHEGEFSRFTGQNCYDRMGAAAELANELGVIVLLKGHRTIITDGIDCYINPTGNSGMAVGGCGDVLAGMITALLGIGLSPLLAAACGAWLHGAAGDLCAQQLCQYSMLPSDMLNVLPRLLK